MRIEFNSDICSGHGRCYSLAPTVFDTDDDGYCQVLVTGEVPAELEDDARKGVSNCPEGALKIVD